MTQENRKQSVEASGSCSENDTRSGINKLIDPINKYLGLIGALSIILSFIITWFTSIMASHKIDHNISSYTIFKNISGTPLGVLLVGVTIFVIIYTGWFGYTANEAFGQTKQASGQTKQATFCNSNHVNNPALACCSFLFILSILFSWQWVPSFWSNFFCVSFSAIFMATIFIVTRSMIAQSIWSIIIIGALLALMDSAINIIWAADFKVNLWWISLAFWILDTIFISAANIMTVAIYQKKNIEKRQCIQAVLVFWFAQIVSLTLAATLIISDAVADYTEYNHFWPSFFLLAFALCFPLAGLLLGLGSDRNIFITVVGFLVLAAFVGIMGIGIPQKIYLHILGYQVNRPFSLLVKGENPINCNAGNNYAIPNDGNFYFSCKQSNSKLTYYGEIHIPKYPKKLIKNGSGYLYSNYHCIYQRKKIKSKVANSSLISHNNFLYCIREWHLTKAA